MCTVLCATIYNNNIRTCICMYMYIHLHCAGMGDAVWNSGSMNDHITLGDRIMRDDVEREKEAESICTITEQIQS